MKKSLILTIISIIVLALIGGAFWYLNTQKQGVINNNETVVQDEGENKEVKEEAEEQVKGEDKIEEIDTSGWLNYKNEEYNYSLKYPKDYYAGSEGYGDMSSVIVVNEDTDDYPLYINVQDRNSYLDDSHKTDREIINKIWEANKEYKDQYTSDIEDIIFNNKEAYKFTAQGGFTYINGEYVMPNEHEFIFIFHKGSLIIISYLPDNKIAEKFLETFKLE